MLILRSFQVMEGIAVDLVRLMGTVVKVRF